MIHTPYYICYVYIIVNRSRELDRRANTAKELQHAAVQFEDACMALADLAAVRSPTDPELADAWARLVIAQTLQNDARLSERKDMGREITTLRRKVASLKAGLRALLSVGDELARQVQETPDWRQACDDARSLLQERRRGWPRKAR